MDLDHFVELCMLISEVELSFTCFSLQKCCSFRVVGVASDATNSPATIVQGVTKRYISRITKNHLHSTADC